MACKKYILYFENKKGDLGQRLDGVSVASPGGFPATIPTEAKGTTGGILVTVRAVSCDFDDVVNAVDEDDGGR